MPGGWVSHQLGSTYPEAHQQARRYRDQNDRGEYQATYAQRDSRRRNVQASLEQVRAGHQDHARAQRGQTERRAHADGARRHSAQTSEHSRRRYLGVDARAQTPEPAPDERARRTARSDERERRSVPYAEQNAEAATTDNARHGE